MPSPARVPMAACPSGEELAAFDAEALPPEHSQAVAEHVSDCPSCEAELRVLHFNHTLLACLRRASEDSQFLDESACRELERRACAIAGQQVLATLIDSAPAPCEETWSLPADFGSYRLLERLGRGGMGIVYKAEQQAIQRRVALKIMRSGAHATEEERTRFQREGLAIARVRHGHVVQIYDFGQQAGQMFFAMELLEGGALTDKLQGRPLPPRQAAELVRALAQGVQAAHAQGVIHRDLKPSNVLFAADGTAKITDFGLAKLFDAPEGDTRTDVILGTPSYMSPEQAKGEARTLGPAADVYSLGAILYETLTGQPPFKGATLLQTLELVRTRDAEPPSHRRPGLCRDLEAICLKCLEKEPARRYASAAALADDLRCWLAGEPTRARPPGRVRRAWRAVRRRPRLSAAVVLLAGLALAAPLASYRLDPERPRRNLERRLERGEPVVLIGERDGPAWHSFIQAGANTARTFLDEDGAFTVHSMSKSLVELVRDSRWERYRLRGEVRHKTSETGSTQIGLYVLGCSFATSQGQGRSQIYWTFDDKSDLRATFADIQQDFQRRYGRRLRQKAPRGNAVSLGFQVFLDKPPPRSTPSFDQNLGHDTFKPAGPSAMQWRSLAVEVTPRVVRSFWDGQLSCELSFADLAQTIRQRLEEHNKTQPDSPYPEEEVVDFSPRGGLGLYVDGGSASFRRVVVEPLQEGE